jgi:hypothetical protein
MGKSTLEKDSFFSWFRSDFYRHEDFFYWLTLFSLGFVLCACDKWQKKPEAAGTTPGSASKSFVSVELPEKVTDLIATGNQTCAILASGKLACWGNKINKPVVNDDIINVESVAMLSKTICANSKGDVRCWGIVNGKEIKPGDAAKEKPRAEKVTALSGNYGRFCIAVNSEEIKCWGRIAQKSETLVENNRFVPAPIKFLEQPDPIRLPIQEELTQPVTGIAILEGNQCVLANGHIHCLRGKVGDSKEHYEAIAGSSEQVCAMGETQKTIFCGTNTANGEISPLVARKGLPGDVLKQLVMGHHHGCVVTDKNLAYCWGKNRFGQLGISSNADWVAEPQLSEIKEVQKLALGDNHTCALLTNGSVICWGRGDQGQTGTPAKKP